MEVCPICLDNIESEKDKYIIGHCNHSFHRKCIIQWFSKSNTCPSCRGIVHNIFYVKTTFIDFSVSSNIGKFLGLVGVLVEIYLNSQK